MKKKRSEEEGAKVKKAALVDFILGKQGNSELLGDLVGHLDEVGDMRESGAAGRSVIASCLGKVFDSGREFYRPVIRAREMFLESSSPEV